MKKIMSFLGMTLLLVSIFTMVMADETLYRLPVFETSDVHGYIANKVEDTYEYRFSYISDKVKDVRGYGDSYVKDYAILLDGGDIYQGNVMSNLLEGNSISAVYKLMDYDAVAIGNHEFDWGIENVVDEDFTMLDSKIEDFAVVNDIPVLASNLYYNNELYSRAKSFVILNKTARSSTGEEITVKVAVIGYLCDYSSSIMYRKFTGAGYSVKEDISIPEGIARELEDSGVCDLTILLCHADAEEVANSLSKDTKIDVVFGGHSHSNICGVANGVIFMEPVNHATSYCYLELVFTQNENNDAEFKFIDKVDIVTFADKLESTHKIEENESDLDADIVELTDRIIQRVNDVLNEKIGYITTSATKKGYIEGSGNFSTTAGNWISSIYMRAVEADVAFTNRGAARMDFIIPEGSPTRQVTVGEIYSLFPFENRIYKYEVTYKELLQLLDYAIKDEDRKLITSICGIDCYYSDSKVNSIVFDGVMVYKDGEWYKDWADKKITIATNEYVATDVGVHQGISNPLIEWSETSRLIENEKIDTTSAVEVLVEESINNDGLLTIDITPHFIEE